MLSAIPSFNQPEHGSPRLNLQIITPEGLLLAKMVDQVTATTTDGEVSIVADNQQFIKKLGINVLRYRIGNTEESATVSGGLLAVDKNEVVVISDRATTSPQ